MRHRITTCTHLASEMTTYLGGSSGSCFESNRTLKRHATVSFLSCEHPSMPLGGSSCRSRFATNSASSLGSRSKYRFANGHIEIVPVSAEFTLIERDGVLVAEPDREMPSLTAEMVRGVLERVRR